MISFLLNNNSFGFGVVIPISGIVIYLFARHAISELRKK
jgi:hypothetical protein